VILQLDKTAHELENSALRLFLRLLSIGVQMRTRTITVSDRWLRHNLRLSKDGITIAKREIRSLIVVTPGKGMATRFDLPLDWLPAQDPLLPMPGGFLLRKTRERPAQEGHPVPSQQGTSLSECPLPAGRSVPSQQGGVSLPSRAECPSPAGRSVPPQQGTSTGNQQLTGHFVENARIDSIDPKDPSSSTEFLCEFVDRIAAVNRVEISQREDAEILRQMLSEYRLHFGQTEQASKAPDDKIVARCLAAASIEQLAATLRGMKANPRKFAPGDKDMWFVTLFLNQIYGIPPELTRERFRLHFTPRNQRQTQFSQDLVNQATKGKRLA
jgi:hypothetical protein